MKIYFSLWILLAMGLSSSVAKPYLSAFGFSVELGEEWLVWDQKNSQQNITDSSMDKSNFNALSKLDTVSYLKMMKQVSNGEFEYFYDKASLMNPMKNNMNVRLSEKKFDMNRNQALKYCQSLPEQLPKIYNQKITVSYCGFFELEKYKYFGVIYVLEDTRIAIFEYNMPTKEGQTLILVGGANPAGSKRMQKGLNTMINAIAKAQ
jgi:hypothetical protein